MGSNMTQGGIQAVAAARLGVPVTSMLAVQVAGACAGKMVCISSILVRGNNFLTSLKQPVTI
jgi:L-lactate permease